MEIHPAIAAMKYAVDALDSIAEQVTIPKGTMAHEQLREVVALANREESRSAEIDKLRAELAELRARSTHCENCGCDWLDNGLNPVGCPYCKRNEDKFNPCLNSLVRQVALMMDDCEEHADGSITIDCDISQGFLRRIYDLLVALEDCGYDVMDQTAAAPVPDDVAKDAERYRWIRSDMKMLWGDDVLAIIGESGASFDAAIDAAILAAKEKGQ